MGKTIRGIFQAGLSIAAAIPGPQQPFVAAAAFAFNIANSVLFRSSQKPEQVTTALKTERPARVSAYGRVKMFGAYILFETAPDGTAVDAWAFHEGRIDAVEGWYLGDKAVIRLSNGFVQKGADGAYGDSNIIQIGANLGAAIETAHPPLIAKLPGIWTAAHRCDGVVTGYMLSKPVKAKNYQEVYPAGGPNQTPLAIVIRAQPVFDWRDPAQSVTDPSTWRWSENSWLHLAHYQLVRNGKSWERHFVPTLASWTAAADDADLAIPLKDGGTEPRYRSCVSHNHARGGSEHKAVIAALLATCDGWMAIRSDGALIARAGRYYAPTVSIGPDEVVSYGDDEGIEDESALNEIGVTYVSAAHDYNTVDTDPWTDEDDIVARGAIRSDDLANQVPSHAQARRLAKRKMAQTMAQQRGTFTTLKAGAKIIGERFIKLRLVEAIGTDEEFVAFDGPAEITQLTRNMLTGAITAAWIAADPNIDAWNPATEEGNPSPTGDRVAREPLDPPMIISATPQFSAVGQNPETDTPSGEPTDGTTATGARVLIASTGPMRDDLTWFARWRVGTSGSWNEREYPDADPGPGVSFLTEFVPLVANLNVQTAYTTGDGRLSPWSASVAVNTAAPVVDIMRVTSGGDSRITEGGNVRVGE